MRAITYSVIKYDPVGVLRVCQVEAKKRIERVNEAITKVKGRLGVINGTIQKFQDQQRQYSMEAQHLQSKGGDDVRIRSAAMKVGRLDDSISRLTKVRDEINVTFENLKHGRDTLVVMDENIGFEIDLGEQEYIIANVAHEAWGALRSAFAGAADFDDLRTMTLTYMAEDYNEKMGRIDSYMEDSQKVIDHVDMQNDIYAEKGLKMLENLNQKKLSFDVQPKQIAAPKQTVSAGMFTR
jgi:prefoldin subunit 5